MYFTEFLHKRHILTGNWCYNMSHINWNSENPYHDILNKEAPVNNTN